MKRVYLLLTALVLAAGIAGCDYLPTEENKAKNAVKSILNDPDSARFSGIRKGNGTGDFCGLVNAKNRLGGYVGNIRFAYSHEVAFFAPEDGAPTESEFNELFWDLYLGKIGSPRALDKFESLGARCEKEKLYEKICGHKSSPQKFAEPCNKMFDEGKNLIDQFFAWEKEQKSK